MDKSPDNADSNEKRGQLEDVLRGKTLMVYSYMLKRKDPIGVRELQRDLGFSSPSVANYHIEKLLAHSLVGRDEYGRYYVVQKVQVGVLQAFVNLGGFSFPRLTFFAAFFTTMLMAYLIFNSERLDVYAIAFAIAGASAFWYETIRVWLKRPFT